MTKTSSGNNKLREQKRRVNGERSKSKSEIKQREEQDRTDGRHGNTKNCLACSYLPVAVFIPPVFVCTVYYFAVAPTHASCYTREFTTSTRLVTRVLIVHHTPCYTREFVTLHVICTVHTCT